MDVNSTADDVAKYFRALNLDMKGKTFMVTGANCGLGLETARCIAANGGVVIILSRSLNNGNEAVAIIKKQHKDAEVSTMVLDLSSFKSIRACADAFITSGKPLNVLINNAGIMACPKSLTEDGFESQIGVNHLGHFLLTKLLMPVLAKTGTKEVPARVINLSSMAQWAFESPEGVSVNDLEATKSYDPWKRYGESKLANVLFSKELNSRCAAEGKHVISMSVHPGAILSTNLKRSASISMIISFFRNLTPRAVWLFFFASKMKSIPQGSATTLYATLSPNIVPGGYYEDCRLSQKVSLKAEDKDLAKRLWEASEKAITAK